MYLRVESGKDEYIVNTLSEDPRKGGVETWGVARATYTEKNSIKPKQAGKNDLQENFSKKLGSANMVSSSNKKDDDDEEE